jgi:hypothetical protein
MAQVTETAAIGDVYQLVMKARYNGQEHSNVNHFSAMANIADVETTLVAVMVQCFIDNILPSLATDFQLIETRWKKVAPALGPENIYTPAGAPIPGAGGAGLPSFSSVVVSIRTLLGGRTKRGRMYLGGIPEAGTDGSSIDGTTGFAGALANWLGCIAQNFIAPGGLPGSNQWQMQVYSRKEGGSHLPYGVNGFTPVNHLVLNTLLGTTRSRKVGRGS